MLCSIYLRIFIFDVIMTKQKKITEVKNLSEVEIYLRELENIYNERLKERERSKQALLDRLNIALEGKEIILENSHE